MNIRNEFMIPDNHFRIFAQKVANKACFCQKVTDVRKSNYGVSQGGMGGKSHPIRSVRGVRPGTRPAQHRVNPSD